MIFSYSSPKRPRQWLSTESNSTQTSQYSIQWDESTDHKCGCHDYVKSLYSSRHLLPISAVTYWCLAPGCSPHWAHLAHTSLWSFPSTLSSFLPQRKSRSRAENAVVKLESLLQLLLDFFSSISLLPITGPIHLCNSPLSVDSCFPPRPHSLCTNTLIQNPPSLNSLWRQKWRQSQGHPALCPVAVCRLSPTGLAHPPAQSPFSVRGIESEARVTPDFSASCLSAQPVTLD